MSDVPAPRPDVPATTANVPSNNRKHPVFDQFRTRVNLERQNIENRFGVMHNMAKRGQSDLVSRGLIVFGRTPRLGYYRLITKEVSGCSTHKVPQ